MAFFPPLFNERITSVHRLSFVLFLACWSIFAIATRLYTYKTASHIENIYRSSWRTTVAQFVSFISLYYLLQYEQQFHWGFIVCCYGLLVTLLALNRLLLTYVTEFIFKKVLRQRKVLIVGDNPHSRQLAAYFDKNKNFYALAGVLHPQPVPQSGGLRPFLPAEYVDFAAQHQVTDIYATTLPDEDETIWHLKDAAENRGMRVLFVAGGQHPVAPGYHRIDFIDKMPVFSLRAEPLQRLRNTFRKRVFDILFSATVIVLVLSWLTPLLALIIKLNSKGPVFFKQQRSGRDNQPFWCYKFRSMTVNAQSDTAQATAGDSRITAVGAFIRKTSIDELPQFFNVLLGNMSIVGPRPHMLKHTEEYSAIINKYMVRHYLKPGITGWAQVNGYRGETTEVSLMEKRVACDIEYMENWSLMLDVKIVFMTIINIFRGEEMAR